MKRRIGSISGLYAITPECPDTATLLQRSELALRGGAGILQYRSKTGDSSLQLQQAQSLRKLTHQYHVPLIINDEVEIARAIDADGVHLGRHDDSIESARSLLGRDKVIGVSCYNLLSCAREAVHSGADYVAFGAFFPSQVKPEAAVASLELLRKARMEIELPIVAIGGITATNAQALIQAGADAVAVISALFAADDIERSARNFVHLFESSTT